MLNISDLEMSRTIGRSSLPITVDVVIPVCNEEYNICGLIDQFKELRLPADVRLHLLFIEDSSTDQTVEILNEISSTTDFVSFISLEKGYGQMAAVIYGLYRTKGAAVVMMDGDGSHPVSVIKEMISAYLKGADVVQGLRMSLTGRTLLRKWGKRIFQNVFKLLTGIDYRRQNVYFRLVSRDVVGQILATPRWWRFLRFPLPAKERKGIKWVEFHSSERVHGESKYSLWKLIGLSVDGILSLISLVRLSLLCLIGISLAILSFIAGYNIPAIFLGVAVIGTLLRFGYLSRLDYISHMVVRIQGGQILEKT